MMNKWVAVFVLFLLVPARSAVLFCPAADQSLVSWQSDGDDESKEQQEENKETKQSEKQFDEFFQDEQLLVFNIPSIKLHLTPSQKPVTEYLPAPDLPPEYLL